MKFPQIIEQDTVFFHWQKTEVELCFSCDSITTVGYYKSRHEVYKEIQLCEGCFKAGVDEEASIKNKVENNE